MKYDRIAVTGGCGNLGRALCERLRTRSSVRVVDTGSPVEGFEHFGASITDYAALREAFTGQQVVVHLAAISNPRVTTQEETFRINTHGTWAVFQAAEDMGVRKIVVASSDATTGLLYNPAGYMPRYLPIDEAHPLRPIEAYSLSKEVTEAIARSYASRGKMDVMVIRPTHIMFPDEYAAIRAKGADVNNYHLWAYVSPDDVAQAFERAIDVSRISFDTFLITSPDGLNERPTLDLIRERYGQLPEIRKPEIYQDRPTASVFDITHARDVLGYQPTSDWRRMVAGIERRKAV